MYEEEKNINTSVSEPVSTDSERTAQWNTENTAAGSNPYSHGSSNYIPQSTQSSMGNQNSPASNVYGGQNAYGASQNSYGQGALSGRSSNENPGNAYSNGAFSGRDNNEGRSGSTPGSYESPSRPSAGNYAGQSGPAPVNYGSQNGSAPGSYGNRNVPTSDNYGRRSDYTTGNYGRSTSYNTSYTYGQNNYSQDRQPSYGSYQYSTSGSSPAAPHDEPKKKKNVVARVVAAVCIVCLLVGGVGFAYFNIAGRMGSTAPAQDAIEQQADAAATVPETTTETAQTQDSGIQTTTVSGASMAVVTDVTAVVEEVMPAMVIIHNNYTASANYFGYIQTEEATASGSGIIVGENDSELLIATNYHVIEGADSLEVIFDDEAVAEAVVKGTDSDMDLAVIAVMLEDISAGTRDAIKIATLGDSNALKLGEPAIAIGNALGYGQSVTTGVISALNREVEIEEGNAQTFIQTDAAINPGNSGGALLNLQGEVIGINSNKIGGETIEGMGYAIPVSVAQPIIDRLMNEVTKLKVAEADRGYIGISGFSVTSDVNQYYGIPFGVCVAELTKGGGAAAAGMQNNDIIVEFDGQEITSMYDLQTKLEYYAAGTTVTIKVMRQEGSEYVEKTFDVTLGHAPSTDSGSGSNEGGNSSQGGGLGGFQIPTFPGGKDGEGSDGGH